MESSIASLARPARSANEVGDDHLYNEASVLWFAVQRAVRGDSLGAEPLPIGVAVQRVVPIGLLSVPARFGLWPRAPCAAPSSSSRAAGLDALTLHCLAVLGRGTIHLWLLINSLSETEDLPAGLRAR